MIRSLMLEVQQLKVKLCKEVPWSNVFVQM